jgi:NTP pyrophosphatase (non-canonical NTP hydrolase)
MLLMAVVIGGTALYMAGAEWGPRTRRPEKDKNLDIKVNNVKQDSLKAEELRFHELTHLVLDWGKERNLHTSGDLQPQFVKLVEEMGELAAGIARKDDQAIVDAVGDMLVVLTNLGACHDPNHADVYLEECLAAAWEEIKDRQGKTVNGTFIKD